MKFLIRGKEISVLVGPPTIVRSPQSPLVITQYQMGLPCEELVKLYAHRAEQLAYQRIYREFIPQEKERFISSGEVRKSDFQPTRRKNQFHEEN